MALLSRNTGKQISIPLSCVLIPFFVSWDDYNCVQFLTGMNSQLPTFEPLLHHISSLMEGEKVSLVLFPRKARGLKFLSPGSSRHSSCRLPIFLPAYSEPRLCCLAHSVFFQHASLPKTQSARFPTQIFGIPGAALHMPLFWAGTYAELSPPALLKRRAVVKPTIFNRA